MKKNKKISVIIPAKDEEDYLPITLSFLRNQKGISDLEIIVAVSPKTTDKTKTVSCKYCCKIVTGGRLATARNNGAKKATHDILFFLDADTYPTNENFLSEAIEEFYLRNLDLAGTYLTSNFKGNFFKKIIYKFLFNAENFILLRKEKTKKPKMQSGMFFKKNVFLSLKGFKEGIFGEDSEIAERAVSSGFNYKFGILRNCDKLFTSVRRYERNGIFRVLLSVFYINIKAELFGYDSVKGIYDTDLYRLG